MARFYGTLSGGRGKVTRCGTPNSGLHITANGWNLGAAIIARAVGDDDYFEVYATGGSNTGHSPIYLGRIVDLDGTPTFEAVQS